MKRKTCHLTIALLFAAAITAAVSFMPYHASAQDIFVFETTPEPHIDILNCDEDCISIYSANSPKVEFPS